MRRFWRWLRRLAATPVIGTCELCGRPVYDYEPYCWHREGGHATYTHFRCDWRMQRVVRDLLTSLPERTLNRIWARWQAQ